MTKSYTEMSLVKKLNTPLLYKMLSRPAESLAKIDQNGSRGCVRYRNHVGRKGFARSGFAAEKAVGRSGEAGSIQTCTS